MAGNTGELRLTGTLRAHAPFEADEEVSTPRLVSSRSLSRMVPLGALSTLSACPTHRLIEVQPEAMGFQLAQFTEIARGIDSWDVKARPQL